MSKLTKQWVAELRATWGTKVRPVEDKSVKQSKYLRDKFVALANHYGKNKGGEHYGIAKTI